MDQPDYFVYADYGFLSETLIARTDSEPEAERVFHEHAPRVRLEPLGALLDERPGAGIDILEVATFDGSGEYLSQLTLRAGQTRIQRG